MKIEIKAKKKIQIEWILEMENLGKWTVTTDGCITNRIQDIEGRISDVENMIEEIDSSVKEKIKANQVITHNIQEFWDTMKRPNIRIIGLEEGE